jgi:putative spermidine/putrescine transport system ATP-binding protein
MATRIELRGCSKTFANGTRALEPLDLVVEPGECLVLLGPSGCGKTTLLRMIAGLALPDAGGRIQFDQKDVTALPIESRKVGMVFQSYALFPNMNVAQNIGYGLRIRGDSHAAIDSRVTQLLKLVQLEGYAGRRVDELSGGQKQRVALARAVAIEPSVLLLDEPLTALDAKLRETLRLELKRLLAALAVTSVFVTHDQAEAMALGDRIAVLSKGRIEQIGSAEDIYARPASEFVAQFVGQVNRVRLPSFGEVLVRPEHIRIVAPSLQNGGAIEREINADSVSVDATVRLITFLGNLIQIDLQLDDDQGVVVEVAGLAYASVQIEAQLASGRRVQLTFDKGTFLRPSRMLEANHSV